MLEIGCGWGGFAEFAAGEVGAKVTGITISPAQYEFAKQRMFEQGLAERADIRLIDYRDVEGQFDRVASIEMFEAVGEEYWPAYFGKIRDVLSPGGRAGLQIITIRDELFAHYRRARRLHPEVRVPGRHAALARSGCRRRRRAPGWSGASSSASARTTPTRWPNGRSGSRAAWDDIRGLGFDERFRRLWRFYLGYCEAGFRTERTNVVQLSLTKS